MMPNLKLEFKGEVLFDNALDYAKYENDIVTGDILIASNNKFIAELTVNMTEDGLEYTHYKGPALIKNYNKTWVAISKDDYERLSWGNRGNDNNDYSDYGNANGNSGNKLVSPEGNSPNYNNININININSNSNSKSELVIPEGYSPIVIHPNHGDVDIEDKKYGVGVSRDNMDLVQAVYNQGSNKFSKKINWNRYIIKFIPSIMITHDFAYYRINEYEGAEVLELETDKYKIDKIRDIIKSDSIMDANNKIKEISIIIELDLKIKK